VPEQMLTRWLVELVDCPHPAWALDLAAKRFGGVHFRRGDTPGCASILINPDETRQSVRGFAREVERQVGGTARVAGRQAFPASRLSPEVGQDRLDTLKEALLLLLEAHGANEPEAFMALVQAANEFVPQLGHEAQDEGAAGRAPDSGPGAPWDLN